MMTATIVTGSQGVFWRPSASLRVAPGLRSDRRLATAVLAAICAFTLLLAASTTASSDISLGAETGVAAQTDPSGIRFGFEGAGSPMVVGGNSVYPYDGVLGCCVAPNPGAWRAANESMSARAAAYQRQITGRSGSVYDVGGVKFDGFADGVLLDAKGPGYSSFVRNGEFQPWFQGADSLTT